MVDNQVQHLGEMMQANERALVLVVTSGKGGVGKTTIAANLAVCLGSCGKRVVLVDADFSLANVDLVMGISSRHNISHVVNGLKSIEQIIQPGPAGRGSDLRGIEAGEPAGARAEGFFRKVANWLF
jgi:flagellar biosynthesis protein FlhG